MTKEEYLKEQVAVINNLVDRISVSHLKDIIDDYNANFPPKIKEYVPSDISGYHRTGYPWEIDSKYSYEDRHLNALRPKPYYSGAR
jgi:hypothetical protein